MCLVPVYNNWLVYLPNVHKPITCHNVCIATQTMVGVGDVPPCRTVTPGTRNYQIVKDQTPGKARLYWGCLFNTCCQGFTCNRGVLAGLAQGLRGQTRQPETKQTKPLLTNRLFLVCCLTKPKPTKQNITWLILWVHWFFGFVGKKLLAGAVTRYVPCVSDSKIIYLFT